MLNNLIQTIPILTETEVAEINSVMDRRRDEFQQSLVFDEDKGLMPDPARSSFDLRLLEDDPLCALLHHAMDRGLYEYTSRVMKISPIYTRWPLTCADGVYIFRDPIQLLRYSPGQKYVLHHDTNDYPHTREYHRTFSTVLYLNDDFTGGETAFLDGSFKPKPGEALYFPSNWCFPHQGTEVLSGEKRVAVTWWYSVLQT